MDIKHLKPVLSELSFVGISEVVIEPSETGSLLRGSNADKSLLIFFNVTMSITDKPLGVKNVNALLSRINLFDEEKAAIEVINSSEGNIGILNIKQGRKKASYRCHSPSQIQAPRSMPSDVEINDSNAITFSKEYVDQLNQAISSMSYTGEKEKRTVSIKGNGASIEVTIFDGSDDSFVDEVEISGIDCRGLYDVSPFSKLMKASATHNEGNAIFSISSNGIGLFRVDLLDVVVHPTVA
ncbi:MAG: hypothetical protein JHC38_08770 [Thiotrichales bacterium]|nr:hypothetical protein [Thiotrichales bacterium]